MQCGQDVAVLGQDIAGLLACRIEALAKMDMEVHGLPEEWPDEALAKGALVWVSPPGLERFGVMPGVIGYSNFQRDRNTGVRDGYVGIVVGRELPLTGKVTYAKVHDFTFWPRSEEVPGSPASFIELLGD